MEDNYNPGEWGIAHFEYHKKGERKGITAFGQILAVEKKVVLFEDDCMEYIIEKSKFTFEKKEEPKMIKP